MNETEVDMILEIDSKVESNNSAGDVIVNCEFCELKFSKQEYKGRQKDRWRMHIYTKHLKNTIDKNIENLKHCPIENCSFKTETYDKQRMVQHYICDRHGILEKLIANQLQNDTNVKKDTSNDFETLNDEEEDIIMEIDSKVESNSKTGNNVTIVCEFCGLEFSEKMACIGVKKWRHHIYSKHLKSKIDEAVKDSSTNCPIENCDYETKNPNRQLIIQHYIGYKSHGILEKLIADELQADKNVKNEDSKDDFETVNETEEEDIIMVDHDSKVELNNSGNNTIVCEFCAKEFSEKEFGARRKDRWRQHIYCKHLKNTIDETIDGLKHCPVENCNFKTEKYEKKSIAQHYISAKHGILEVLIGKKHALKNMTFSL